MPTVSFDQLRSLSVLKTAESSFHKAVAAGDAAAFHKLFVKRHAKVRRKLDKLLGENRLASVWSASALAEFDEDSSVLNLVGRRGEAAVPKLVAHLVGANASWTALETLVAIELLVRCTEALTPEQTVHLYVALSRTDVNTFRDAAVSVDPDSCPTVRSAIVAGEIPLLLGLVLESVQKSELWLANGIEHIADCIEGSSDTDGTIHAALSRGVGQWLAPFTRLSIWSKVFKKPWARPATLERWSECIAAAGTLLVRSGFLSENLLQSNAENNGIAAIDLMGRAVEFAELPEDSGLPSLLKSLSRDTSGRKPSKTKATPSPSSQSDWAASAVLRNTLAVDADVMTLDWESADHRLNVAARGARLLTGAWQTQINVDGKPLVPTGNWVCTCWFLDEEVAFAELEAGSASGVRHVRHVMLALKEHFAVIMDTVAGVDESTSIEFESRLGLSPSFSATANSITREVQLTDGEVSVRAIPGWLADDRVQSTAGKFHCEQGELILQTQTNGGVALPLVLDWHPERQHRDADWNSLTITEERRVNTTHEANAFRVRVGTLQLLLFRSLRRGETLRAVLGHHTDSETVYAHIRNSGKIDPLLMVESDA